MASLHEKSLSGSHFPLRPQLHVHTTYDDLEKLGWDQRILQEL